MINFFVAKVPATFLFYRHRLTALYILSQAANYAFAYARVTLPFLVLAQSGPEWRELDPQRTALQFQPVVIGASAVLLLIALFCRFLPGSAARNDKVARALIKTQCLLLTQAFIMHVRWMATGFPSTSYNMLSMLEAGALTKRQFARWFAVSFDVQICIVCEGLLCLVFGQKKRPDAKEPEAALAKKQE